jgi:hypothetical protein
MFFAVESVPANGEYRVRITVGADQYEFSLLIPWSDLRNPRGRELVTAWAIGLFTAPGSGISHELVQGLLDYLDERFPIERPLFRRPRLRLW